MSILNNDYKDFLFYKYDKYRENNSDNYTCKEVPDYIVENLKYGNLIREYQKNAFTNFITFINDDRGREDFQQIDKFHLLFHMATGSGKTLIMAGLILYLFKEYKYRNFLFFVGSTEILEKTKLNFTDKSSDKYLFTDKIIIDGKEIEVNLVNNFNHTDKDKINICFTTIHNLAERMWVPKEDDLSVCDFSEEKVVMIADEAHHLNQESKKNKYNNEDVREYLKGNRYNKEKESKTWEYTVGYCLEHRVDNILLEFTATCPIDKNEYVREKYKNKIIYNYNLIKYREDGYSKEIRTFKTPTNISKMDRALIACVFNEFRQILFSEYLKDKNYKPVILFKSKYSDEDFKKKNEDNWEETSKYNMGLFIDYIKNLTVNKLKDVFSIKNDDPENKYIEFILKYFKDNDISMTNLLNMLKNDFKREKILYANETNEKELKNIVSALNSLESYHNEYRAIFDCKKLTEGWDVLNLYDIVRLDDKRQGANAESTVSEAQLIGRGARYYPFAINKDEDKYVRKYDGDDTNPLYFLETMFYHCYADNNYISELRLQLREQGIIDDDSKRERVVKVKKDFMNTSLYRDGYFFKNDVEVKENDDYKVSDIIGKFPSQFEGYIEGANSEKIFEDNLSENKNVKIKNIKIKDIAKNYYYLVRKCLISRNQYLRFDKLKNKYIKLESIREFLTSDKYIGDFVLEIKTINEKLSPKDFEIVLPKLFKIINDIVKNENQYKGTKIFNKVRIKDVIGSGFVRRFDDEKLEKMKNNNDCGEGISQTESVCSSFKKPGTQYVYDMKINNFNDLNWYVFEDNIGTTEEKAFVYEFSKRYDDLEKNFDMVRLIRNEKNLKLHRFEDGEGFEPDYILILKKKNSKSEYLQIFFEPKGIHIMQYDEKKEKFLFAIKNDKDVKVEKIPGQTNEIIGAPFYNMDYEHNKNFNDFIDEIIDKYK